MASIIEELDDHDSAFGGGGSAFPPALVSLTPFTPSASPSPRRLSSCFTQPSKPVRAKRQLAWVSLQGRLVGADEATSARAIDRNGEFSAAEAAAWELFTPIQRVLVVAVVAAAAIHSKKNKQIKKLQKSVELRDQVLLSMQQKLYNLCQQVNCFNDQPQAVSLLTAVDPSVKRGTGCGCKPCQFHNLPPTDVSGSTKVEGSNGEVYEYKAPLPGVVEPEERRMSDWSDYAPSFTSSVDIQSENLAVEHNISSLQKECEGKDITIKKLSSFVQSSEVSGSKRIAELEDIIRRKNMIINKLRKDILVLEQKVMNLTRLRRGSFSSAGSNAKQLPFMADNMLYDMESTTSPSSSDSDSSPRNRTQAPACKIQEISVQVDEKSSRGDQKCVQLKSSKFTEQRQRSVAPSPLKERSLNQTPNSVPPLKPKHDSGGENRTRRRPLPRYKEVTAPKRWI